MSADDRARLTEEPSAKVSSEDLVQRLRDLQKEKDDEENYYNRLKAKETRLDQSVKQVQEDILKIKKEMTKEQTRESSQDKGRERERKAKVKNQEDRIRDHLGEVLYAKPLSDGVKTYELDTVEVFFDRQTERYLLTFRIDQEMTIEQLRSHACKYWGLKPDDYILKTMANSKCQDKVHIKACFRQGEVAELRLEPKTAESSEPAEEALKAIQPRKKGAQASKSSRAANVVIEQIQKFNDTHAKSLRRMGGVYFLLKVKDSKPTEHVAKIKLRDIIVYLLLTILTVFVYVSRRPEGNSFWLRKSFEDNFYKRLSAPDEPTRKLPYVPGFQEVRSVDEMWDWLGTTLPNIIWSNSSRDLGAYNALLGYVSIRIQNVKDPGSPSTDSCYGSEQLAAALGAKCWAEYLTTEDQETATLPDIQTYWNGVKSEGDLRGPADPSQFVTADKNYEDHRITPLWGHVVTYDASGYSVNYRMRQADPAQSAESYRNDMKAFRNLSWISNATRVVIVSLNAYNFQCDLWISCDLIFETPGSGSVLGRASFKPFKQNTVETEQERRDTRIDYIRVSIGFFYIFLLVGWLERKHKTKNHKAGILYYMSLNGMADVVIVICLAVVTIWRWAQFQSETTAQWLQLVDDSSEEKKGFQSFSHKSFNYEVIFVVEGVLFLVLMYRMMGFVRLNRIIYLMLHALGGSFKMLGFFVLLFMPSMTGFTFLTNKIFGAYSSNFSLLSFTLLELYSVMSGTANVSELGDEESFWALFMLISFYVVINFGLLNACIASIVDTYYVVHLTQGLGGGKWTGKQWRRWILGNWLYKIIEPRRHKKGREEGSSS